MGDADAAVDAAGDLVMLALSGVQRFIREARSTGDLGAASVMVSLLAQEAARACAEAGARVVFPAGIGDSWAGDTPVAGPAVGGATADVVGGGAAGVPNRVVALAESGEGPRVAEAAAGAVRGLWARWVEKVFHRAVVTPGFPVVVWVCAPAGLGSYAARWEAAQAGLVARRRVRDFGGEAGGAVEFAGRRLCSLSPRWPAEDALPPRLKPHQADVLCAANWVKRLWRSWGVGGAGVAEGFASTPSIASAPFRAEVVRRIGDGEVREHVVGLWKAVQGLVPEEEFRARETPVAGLPNAGEDGLAVWVRGGAGRWMYPETWSEPVLLREYPQPDPDGRRRAAVASGRNAARGLVEVMARRFGVGAPARYLALVMQDADGMGRYLSGAAVGADGVTRVGGGAGEVTAEAHRAVSRRLRELAEAQTAAVRGEGLLGVPVYAGGDDLLALVPAVTALETARTVRALMPGDLPTASTAVLFFHHTSSLRLALAGVRELLEGAKTARPAGVSAAPKDALAVGYVRRSGVREHAVQPWRPGLIDGGDGAESGGGEWSSGLFRVFMRAPGRGALSPRLVADLERDVDALAGLTPEVFAAELGRLVERHGGTWEQAGSLRRLGEMQYVTADAESTGVVPLSAAQVAVFLRQECG